MSTQQKHAKLRVCMSCEWLFRLPAPDGCPKCQWGHYGARFVYGVKAYEYERTQAPWKRNKIAAFTASLNREIAANKPPGQS